MKKLRDRSMAAILLMVAPVVYLSVRPRPYRLQSLLEVLAGRRMLVGGGGGAGPDPVFTVAGLCHDEPLSIREITQVEEYYAANSSLLLDCEIIVSTMRSRGATASADAIGSERAVGTTIH